METIKTFKLFSINCCIHWSAKYLTYFVSISVWKCEMKIYLHHLFWYQPSFQTIMYKYKDICKLDTVATLLFPWFMIWVLKFWWKTISLQNIEPIIIFLQRDCAVFKAISHSFSSPSAKSPSTNVNQKISPLQPSVYLQHIVPGSGDEEEEDKLLAGGGSERPLGLRLLQLPQQTRDRGRGDTRGLGHADQLLLHAGIRKL